MKSFVKITKKYYLRKSIICLLTYCVLFYTSVPAAMALDEANVISSTGATFAQMGDNSIINTNNGAVINWSNFDTSSTQTVTFNQYIDGSLNPNSAVLNRISGAATQFDGTLTANGSVFIVNPAGVYFGPTSSVNVNQLVASGLSMSPEDFEAIINDPANLMIFNGGGGGDVVNNGTINAADSVYLVGKNVINNGAISCPAGLVVMAAGDGVYLRQDGSNVFIEVATASDVTNSGTVTAGEGGIVLAAGDTFSSAIANVGTLAASGGTVTAEAACIENSGTINVNSTDGDGGNVTLEAAEELIIAGTSIITANAGISNSGANGGDIVAKSDDSIIVNDGAQFETRGGSYTDSSALNEDTTYDGGRVEITGERVYVYGGDVDASVSAGAYNIDDPENPGQTLTVTPEAGSWMIDFPELTISGGAIPSGDPAAVENTLYAEWIESQSQAGTNLEMVAHSTTEGSVITVEPFDELNGGSGDIALRTRYNTGGIEFLPDTGGNRTAIHTNDGADVYMLAGAGGIVTGDIITYVPSSDKVTEPGKIRLYTNNYGDITTGELSVSGGSYDEISVVSCGDLTVNGSVETVTNQNDNEVKSIGQARTCLVSVHGNVEINGNVTVDAHGKYATTADVHICAGRNVAVNLATSQGISATAKTSEYGPANASIQIHSGKFVPGSDISITGDGPKPVHVKADAGGSGAGAVEYTSSGNPPVDLEDTNGAEGVEAHAKLEIIEDYEGDCPDCPKPPHIDPPIIPTPPTGAPDFATTPKYDYISIDVLDNDTGQSDLSIILDSKDTTNGGKVKLDPYGGVTYTPPADLSSLTFDENGEATDTFTYKVMDEGGLVSEIVTVTVTLKNNLPNTALDTAETLKSSDIFVNVLANDTDNDALDQLTVLSTSGTSTLGGTITINSDGTVTYSPPDDLSGITFDENGHAIDSFTYVATDSFNNAGSEVTVTLVNQIPSAGTDTVTTNQSQPVNSNVLDNDTDLDGENLSVVLDGVSPQHGQLTLNQDGSFTYTPDDGYVGEDSFKYIVSDGFNSALGTVLILVGSVATAPLPENMELAVSGCPALIQWTAEELGIEGENIQIWMTNTLASLKDIQPCDACTRLKSAVMILQDTDGSHIAALTQVIDEFASSDAPVSEEQMASIADAIANNTQADNAYALAGAYLDALTAYVTVVSSLGLSTEDAITVATDKYIAPLIDSDNAGLAAYLTARMTAMGQ
ncbi:MAG: cadherin-like domain-containing protein [Sedimentisphaerales bacterium]|nr:cadherin-like domain-containing protein [Sedimentisphaerales bacterium]